MYDSGIEDLFSAPVMIVLFEKVIELEFIFKFLYLPVLLSRMPPDYFSSPCSEAAGESSHELALFSFSTLTVNF